MNNLQLNSANKVEEVSGVIKSPKSTNYINNTPLLTEGVKCTDKNVSILLQVYQVTVNSNNLGNKLWPDVVQTLYSRRQKVVEDMNTNILKGIPKSISIHIYRLLPDTTVENLKNLLKDHFPILSCTKLDLKYGQLYSTFKIDINYDYYNLAFDSNIRLKDTRVKTTFSCKAETRRMDKTNIRRHYYFNKKLDGQIIYVQ